MLTLTVGVFASILHESGLLLVQRRKERESIIPGKNFYGDYELPGGRLDPEEMADLLQSATIQKFWQENAYLRQELSREWHLPSIVEVLKRALRRQVKREEGLEVFPGYSYVGRLYRAILVQRGRGEIDVAVCIPVLPHEWRGEPTRDEMSWVSPARIKELCERPEGEQVVAGWGKRMCQMMLWGLTFSPNSDYQRQAKEYLDSILREKGNQSQLETVSII